MKKLVTYTGMFALMAGAAFAQETTVIHHDGPDGDKTVIHRSSGADVDKKVVTHDADGCTSKTVTRSNEMGDSMSKTKSNC